MAHLEFVDAVLARALLHHRFDGALGFCVVEIDRRRIVFTRELDTQAFGQRAARCRFAQRRAVVARVVAPLDTQT